MRGTVMTWRARRQRSTSSTLLAEMAVLKNELRLQSRQFKNTLDELRCFGNDLRAHSERLQERTRARARAGSRRSRARPRRQFLLALIDVRDRLQSGVNAARRPPSSFLTRLLPGPTRLCCQPGRGSEPDPATPRRTACRPSRTADPGRRRDLDPQRMRVVGLEAATGSAAIPDGSVVREVQRGFFHDGELLRIAEVIVSKKANRT
jgi:molecular chaperone GrpE